MNNRPEYSPKKYDSGFYGNKYFHYRYNSYLDRDIIYFNPNLVILFSIIVTGLFSKMAAYLLNN